MLESYIIIILVLLLIIVVGYLAIYFSKWKSNSNKIIKNEHVNEDSFQNYAKFYGETIPHDEVFKKKLNKICFLITKQKMTDINKIATLSNCTLPECILKIKYLKNKRLIDDLYIDTNNMELLPCTLDDQELLDKYKPYIYGSHSQISDIITTLPNPEHLSIIDFKKKVLDDLIYLDKKDLLNGVKIDDIDGSIIYYTIEKRKTVHNRETVHCNNCGALNDVEITGKTRCGYCNSIVVGSEFKSM